MKVDENLYSRQLYVLGRDAMIKMMESSVIIVGMDGLGQEVAKNITLAGVNSLTLFDKNLVTMDDLAVGFYFKEEDIGNRRDYSVERSIKELNPYVHVRAIEELNEISSYSLLILCNKDYDEQIKYNNLCRENNVRFIGCQTRGFFSQVFCDFLDELVVIDPTGEEPAKGAIKEILEDGRMLLVDRHQLEDGDVIEIIAPEHEGYDKRKFKIKSLNHKELKLTPLGADVTKTKNFHFMKTKGGNYEQKILPEKLSFKKLEELINNPMIIQSTDSIEIENIIHSCFKLAPEFLKNNKEISKKNYNDFLEFYKLTNNSEYKDDVVKSFALQYSYQVMPMVSVIGGLVAQEALKACSSKFTPLKQFLYFFSNIKITEEITEVESDRYSTLFSLFGKENMDKILSSSVFVVGSGAIGCEHLKNLAMMGVGTKGKIYLTDMDSIEQSNLNRQFLFRRDDVTKMKSEVAAREITKINNKIIVEPFTYRIAEETENIFSDDFFSKITLVANALDNVDSRVYMDGRCINNRIPLFDSGTLGTKGNSQVIIPFVTESYTSSQDPPEKSIPLCTLRNFPHLIEHTIEWALSEFNSQFNKNIFSIKEFLCDNTDDVELLSDDLGSDIKEMVRKAPFTKNECIRAAISLFVRLYHTSIKTLVSTFPPDHITDEGLPFWEPPRIAPTPISFDHNIELHVLFVISASNLYAQAYGIKEINLSTDSLCQAVENIHTNENPIVSIDRDDVLTYLNDEVYFENYEKINYVDLETTRKKLKPIIPEVKKPLIPENLTPLELEKDDDTNHHVDFIYSASNLRAINYKIKTADRLTVKGIAGKIIPAIATTTSLISGLSTLEIIKYIIGQKDFRNTFVNLALPFIGTSEPLAPLKNKINVNNEELEYTLWDRIEIKDTTVKNFIEYFKSKYQLDPKMITYKTTVIFCTFYNKEKFEINLTKNFKEIIKDVEHKKYINLEILFEPHIEEFIPIYVIIE